MINLVSTLNGIQIRTNTSSTTKFGWFTTYFPTGCCWITGLICDPNSQPRAPPPPETLRRTARALPPGPVRLSQFRGGRAARGRGVVGTCGGWKGAFGSGELVKHQAGKDVNSCEHFVYRRSNGIQAALASKKQTSNWVNSMDVTPIESFVLTRPRNTDRKRREHWT